MTLFSKEWFRAAAERAVKTAAQTTAAVVTVGTTGLTSVNWTVAGLTIGIATLGSLVTSILSPDALAKVEKAVTQPPVQAAISNVEKAVLPGHGGPALPPGVNIPVIAPPAE